MTVSHPSRLHCREVVEHIGDLIDGELAGDDVIRIEQHLLVCPPCTLYVRQLRDTIAIARETRTPRDEAPMASPAATAIDVFRRWKAKGTP